MPKKAKLPFDFHISPHLIKITEQQAFSVRELYEGIKVCSDASIFYHTFQSLHDHHFITEGFSNDFAQWISASCEEEKLAEKVAGLDIREYTKIEALRDAIVDTMLAFLNDKKNRLEKRADEPFYFLESVNVILPTGLFAEDLRQFCECLAQTSIHSISFHFIESRLRLDLSTSDFSRWIEEELDLPELAEDIDEIDIYTNTLEGIRQKLIETIYRWIGKWGA